MATPATRSATLYATRRRRNLITMGLAFAATAFGLSWLVLVLADLFWEGFSGLSIAVFTEMTPPPGSAGGLLNPIAGSLVMTFVAVAIGTPLGILAGTYLAEYGRYEKLSMVVRFINDILLSAPSIVIGLFIYEVMVAQMGHFSGMGRRGRVGGYCHSGGGANHRGHAHAGARYAPRGGGLDRFAALADDPEGRLPGGAGRHDHRRLLAIARISGETAPLLFTALNNQFWSLDMNAPVSSLPVVIFQFALSPYKDWQQLAWTGALIITLAVLALSITARALAGQRKSS